MSTWLLVGLGNPGAQYELTRHNAGFLVVDELAHRAGASFSRASGMFARTLTTVVSTTGIGIPPGDRVVIAKPSTFMNDSGKAVGALMRFHKIPADHLIVVHDELDIDLGQTRLKFGGGDNGHNGLRSIKAHIHTGDYYRVRMGIGRPPGRMPVVDYVLRPFAHAENDDLALALDRGADACQMLMTHGLTAAQNHFNN